MADVISQHVFLDAPERRPHGRDLRHDIDAVAILLHHAGQAAHLTFDARETFEAGGFRSFHA